MSSPFKYKLLFGLAAAIFAGDQATKLLVESALPFGAFYPPDCIEVVPGYFNIVHVGNTGAAWSLFSGYSRVLGLIGFLALGAIWFFRRSLMLEQIRHQWIFGAIAGGILGNVIDRIRLGYVIDFLDFHYDSFYWPSFNVADSAITLGVIVYIATTIVTPQKPAAEKS